jgi:uncharacterized protein YndB with AHSA1/START domain
MAIQRGTWQAPDRSNDAARFELHTAFELAAPRETAYLVIRDVAAWPTWWRGCLAVTELAPGDDNGIGARQRIVWRGRLPYEIAIEVEVTDIRRGQRIVAASVGDLDGVGTWTLSDAAGGTRIEYLWQVSLRKRWMHRLAPLLPPLFRWNHDWPMANGAVGLARHLGVAPPPRPRSSGSTARVAA